MLFFFEVCIEDGEETPTLVFVKFVLGEILEQVFRHGERTTSYEFLDGVNAEEEKGKRRERC